MPLAPIPPPARVDPNAEYRFTYCQDQLVLLLLQRTLDAVTANDTTGLATEVTLAAIKSVTDQMTFTGGDLNVNASVTLPAGLATEAKQDDQITLATAANALLTSISNEDFATEATLVAAKAVLDAIKLDTAKLDVNLSTVATEATLELIRLILVDLETNTSSNNTFGDTPSVTTAALTDVSSTVLAANTDRKETIYYNDSNDVIWLFYGTPAVFGTGIPLFKQQQFTNERYRGQVTAIMDTGKTGNLQVTDVLV